jgi:hypothetical protein
MKSSVAPQKSLSKSAQSQLISNRCLEETIDNICLAHKVSLAKAQNKERKKHDETR